MKLFSINGEIKRVVDNVKLKFKEAEIELFYLENDELLVKHGTDTFLTQLGSFEFRSAMLFSYKDGVDSYGIKTSAEIYETEAGMLFQIKQPSFIACYVGERVLINDNI